MKKFWHLFLLSFIIILIYSSLTAHQSIDTWVYKTSAPFTPKTYADGIAITRVLDSGTTYFCALPGGTTYWWHYRVDSDSWTIMSSSLPAPSGYGASLIWTGGDYLYYVRGSSTTEFYGYSISTANWVTLSSAPDTIAKGGSAVWAGGDFIYVIRGADTYDFWAYSIADNSWTAKTQTNAKVDNESTLAWDENDNLYFLRGGEDTFYKYVLSSDSWITLTGKGLPDNLGVGGSLISVSTSILYCVRGAVSTDYYKYDISQSSWTSPYPASTPENVGTNRGNRLVSLGDYIYCLKGTGTGSNKSFWSYRWRDINAPGIVTSFVAETGTNRGEINLSWISPGNDGYLGELPAGSTFYIQYASWTGVAFSTTTQPPVSGYHLSIPTGPVTPGSTQFYTLNGLLEGVIYYFRIWSRDNAGNWSDISIGATTWAQLPIPSAPKIFFGLALSTDSIKWEWDDVSDETGYQIFRASDNEVIISTDVISTDVTSYVESGFALPNLPVGRYVRAFNNYGLSALSPSATVYTLANLPININMPSVCMSSVTLTWSANGNPPWTTYELQYSTTNDFSSYSSSITQSLTHLITYLMPDTTYYFKVKAFNGDNIGTNFSEVNFISTLKVPGENYLDLVINEIMYNPQGADTYSEWIELYNRTSTNIDLTGWFLKEDNETLTGTAGEIKNTHLVQGSLVIPAGGYIILADSGTYFLNSYSDNPPSATWNVIDTSIALANTVDTIFLVNPSFKVISSVTYSNTWNNSVEGKSTEKINSGGSETNASNWGESIPFEGTPGVSNSLTPPPPDTPLINKYIDPNKDDTLTIFPYTDKAVEIIILAGTFNTTVNLSVERSTSVPKPDLIKQPHLKGTGIGIEILAKDKTGNLLQPQKPIKITFKYAAEEVAGVKEENLALAHCRETKKEWGILPSQVYPSENKIVTEILHLSLFQIVECVAVKTVDNVFVYPNPCYLSKNQKPTFARLPANAQIIVYTVNGERIFEAIAGTSGYYTWEIKNLASGIYIFLVKDPATGKKKFGKLAIIK